MMTTLKTIKDIKNMNMVDLLHTQKVMEFSLLALAEEKEKLDKELKMYHDQMDAIKKANFEIAKRMCEIKYEEGEL